jgi:uncharacterized protein (UPF0212 family)
MRALTAEGLLIASERLRLEPMPRRAAAILALATGMTDDEAMALPVGERDDRLLAVRAVTFGPEMASVAECPACGERCEATLDAAQFRAAGAEEAIVDVEESGWYVRARLPNSHDVAIAAQHADAGTATRDLLARCIVDQRPEGELPAGVAAAVEAALERADPRADIRLLLVCPSCGESWESAFDIGAFFGGEIRAAAERLAREVHVLASAYGWSERDILSMTEWRRQLYIDLVSE